LENKRRARNNREKLTSRTGEKDKETIPNQGLGSRRTSNVVATGP
jgi:hypothetical protein